MENTREARYVATLEKTIQNDCHFLKETVQEFREWCLMVTPERNVPSGIVIDIRETYKEIQNRLSEINAIQQLLQGKYRRYYRRNPLQDKEILEWGFIAKTFYNKFESNLKQMEEKRKQSEKERTVKPFSREGLPQWFHSPEKRIMLLRNFRILGDLNYDQPSASEGEERRGAAQDRFRSLTLFVFTGDGRSLDGLQSRIQLREHDVLERYGPEELRGVLTHLSEVGPLEVEEILKRFMGQEKDPRLKCLHFSVRSAKDLGGELFAVIKRTMDKMAEGEVSALSFETSL
jgi:hypothetical protein